MDKIINKINMLIDKCDLLTHNILAEEPCSELLNSFCAETAGFLQDIYCLYSLPEYSSHADDIPAWTSLIANLIGACQGDDILKLLDIISYEIKYNLLEVKGYVEGNTL